MLIKQIKKGDFKLIHETYIDDMGFERDSFEITKINKNGSMIHKPIYPPITTNTYKPNRPVKLTNTYTLKEYKETLKEEIDKF